MTGLWDPNVAPQRQTTAPDRRALALAALGDFIRRCWRGEARLWKVFWLLGMLGAAAVGYAVGLVKGVVLSSPMWIGVGLIFWGLAVAGSVAYQVWTYVSIWRCAFNAGWKGWGYIARALVVFGVLGTIYGLIALFQKWGTLI